MHKMTREAESASLVQRTGGQGRDFPFYNGEPVAISNGQWLFVMASIAMAFLALILPIPWPGGLLAPLIPAWLFAAIPLAALAHVAPGHWQAIFGRVGWRDLGLMLGFALLNLIVSMAVGAILHAFADVTPNGATAQLGRMAVSERVVFFAKTIPQLFGEELLTLLPFLFALTVLSGPLAVDRKRAVAFAWLLSALIFALLHLPTYDWNLPQCLIVIGTARLVLTLPWLLTKNIWVSTGAHILNDWVLFGLGILGASMAGQA